MTKGQRFAKDMRKNLSIGTRTHRWSSSTFPGSDMHEMILESIAHATHHDSWYGEARTELFRTAFAALCSYEKHIWSGRADAVLVAYCNNLTPWQLCNLLGDMVDAKITNVGEGERFFAQFLQRNQAQIYARLN
ncbi:hypothetical protein OG883_42700 [Streptomyces sp. NBC_01142]|uniref:hypothetical protein n=1 Tax=Streptomyces sp. NBC_01142 TaxID=2975865 RepID=UPI00224D52EF|nr:hypothetical protein [Streptomyces sp. NBC_01142]MCX4826354.1 hypothetical protein [Streptomyces sp. NBC_01142]